MSFNNTNFSIKNIDNEHMICIAPEYEYNNPKVLEIFQKEAAFAIWFENDKIRYVNQNFIKTHVFKAAYSTSIPKDVLQTLYLACNYRGLPRKHNKKADNKPKTKRVCMESIKNGHKQHNTHQPEKVQNMICSRLPAEMKQ
ncbi:hypothetical protein PHYBLDRAFT_138767 [Phycomyces blakesleeanus NRRL 1555(-)]|uniref:Uncharacterized protein n=1 Tax=Phycomyces blakesleeanus (strain ATCC 8743b / DSM 1359 / FGSC 10004 / NBRC 33097 / NRRL 1555) TaxID=763407 RepID=A0A167RAD5_PHYB8|nr:hypothetical protein PHYBLDRAFT_138767 [Phycomyces blakesleeanus NRRL 1555(-)]OAD81218.1 hypothetical protein PHYBLDRAFT_138767 [Phycomyces blakesleeanus NRRL 1555(-)]|eukprot:XP_018299258.1 hypothetical protein PHYBLDRAFT_138767 [Phycomyces blakesleeanus NRRL 1555(-)]